MRSVTSERSFVHAFWGDHSEPLSRSHKVRKDFVLAAEAARAGLGVDPLVMVWGQDNLEYIRSFGVFRTCLVKNDPWDEAPPTPRHTVWTHKIKAWQLAMTMYEQIVGLDVDVRLLCPLPEDFWQKMAEKDRFQANLFRYECRKCPWRRRDKRRQPSGAFVYCRDQIVMSELLELAVKHPWGLYGSEETAMAWWTDQQQGGWQSPAAYAARFEPYCCYLPRKTYCTKRPEERVVIEAKQCVFTYEYAY